MPSRRGTTAGQFWRVNLKSTTPKIYLKRLRESAREALVSPSPELAGMPIHTLYGKKPDSARNEIASLKSFSELDHYSQTRTAVALNVPAPYPDNWAPSQYAGRLEPFTRRAEALDFTVLYDGVRLEKPIVLTATARTRYSESWSTRANIYASTAICLRVMEFLGRSNSMAC